MNKPLKQIDDQLNDRLYRVLSNHLYDNQECLQIKIGELLGHNFYSQIRDQLRNGLWYSLHD